MTPLLTHTFPPKKMKKLRRARLVYRYATMILPPSSPDTWSRDFSSSRHIIARLFVAETNGSQTIRRRIFVATTFRRCAFSSFFPPLVWNYVKVINKAWPAWHTPLWRSRGPNPPARRAHFKFTCKPRGKLNAQRRKGRLA